MPFNGPSDQRALHAALSPRKKALLIGINYEGNTQLYGPQQDAKSFADLLIQHFGYDAKNVVIMLDRQDEDKQMVPTEANVLRELNNLVQDARPGDHFVFYYAGHGGQIPCTHLLKDEKDSITSSCYSEVDGQDEVIIAADGLSILDNVLREVLVDRLPPGASLNAIFDACHSGTLLDLDHSECNRRQFDKTYRFRRTPGGTPRTSPVTSTVQLRQRTLSRSPQRSIPRVLSLHSIVEEPSLLQRLGHHPLIESHSERDASDIDTSSDGKTTTQIRMRSTASIIVSIRKMVKSGRLAKGRVIEKVATYSWIGAAATPSIITKSNLESRELDPMATASSSLDRSSSLKERFSMPFRVIKKVKQSIGSKMVSGLARRGSFEEREQEERNSGQRSAVAGVRLSAYIESWTTVSSSSSSAASVTIIPRRSPTRRHSADAILGRAHTALAPVFAMPVMSSRDSLGVSANDGLSLMAAGATLASASFVQAVQKRVKKRCAGRCHDGLLLTKQSAVHVEVVSFSACADGQLSWEGPRGTSMTQVLIEYLKQNPSPTYRSLWTHMNDHWDDTMRVMRDSYRKARKKPPFGMPDYQYPQFSSMQPLDLDAEFTL
ncbi:peptidase C14 [Laetiporus sulphureus 93-53]|uniref:Peptidase C14 n=1 Tax=Laetiporus sulphureus 93-53 TaxID=1314785 RepID=A0A165EHP8_9APHY|nr:peptidase C14 [Laetiporus sulphureus 93-53]KZT07071.1 peptidase C14 [Laetiporus sulphureus 93-53]